MKIEDLESYLKLNVVVGNQKIFTLWNLFQIIAIQKLTIYCLLTTNELTDVTAAHMQSKPNIPMFEVLFVKLFQI